MKWKLLKSGPKKLVELYYADKPEYSYFEGCSMGGREAMMVTQRLPTYFDGSVSGDLNPIHMHPLTAKAFGFPTAIAHGMWTKARCLAALHPRLPDHFRVEVQFRKPILLPATVQFGEEEDQPDDSRAAHSSEAGSRADGKRERIRFNVRGAGKGTPENPLEGFDVVSSTPVSIADDVAAAADPLRGYAALYVGGMGSREQNFYNQLATRMGYGDAAREVQDLYLAKQHRDAAAAVPLEFIDRTSLLGPVERIAERMREFAAAGVTTLSVSLFVADVESGVQTLRQVADALDRSGVGE